MLKKYVKKILVMVFWIFPIKRNRIICWDFKGESYGGNTRAISDYLAKRDDCEIVWVIKNKQIIDNKKIITVKPNTIKSFYYIATSKIWIETHNFFPDICPKRTNQIAIQTWHGALPIKTIEGFDSEYFSKEQIDNMKKSSQITDYLLTNGKLSTDLLKKGMFYEGKILEYGSPRCDILKKCDTFQKKIIVDAVRKRYKIPANVTNFILYAPTYRDDDNQIEKNFKADIVCETLENKFGGKWICLFRLHPLADKIEIRENVVDVRDYENIEDLMVMADICISDYSSIIMDFMFTLKPCFLYAYDYSEYSRTRGFSLNYDELPFPHSQNMRELIGDISNYDSSREQNRMKEYMLINRIEEDGNATSKLCKLILKTIGD